MSSLRTNGSSAPESVTGSTASSESTQFDPGWRLHHLGFVVDSIRAVADRFARSIGAAWGGEIFYDPLQLVQVSFIQSKNLAVSVELVEPAGPGSPVEHFLQRGGGLHHMCYEVTGLEEQLKLSQSLGGVVVRPPLPAVAFDGRRIAWVVTRDKLRLEFLEAACQG